MNKEKRALWKEFKDSGLLWWINSVLRVFGWKIVCETNENGKIISVYPTQVKFKRFDEETDMDGFEKLIIHMKNNAGDRYDEIIFNKIKESMRKM